MENNFTIRWAQAFQIFRWLVDTTMALLKPVLFEMEKFSESISTVRLMETARPPLFRIPSFQPDTRPSCVNYWGVFLDLYIHPSHRPISEDYRLRRFAPQRLLHSSWTVILEKINNNKLSSKFLAMVMQNGSSHIYRKFQAEIWSKNLLSWTWTLQYICGTWSPECTRKYGVEKPINIF